MGIQLNQSIMDSIHQGIIPTMDSADFSNFKMMDAVGGAFFQRELELIKAQSYDVLYADLPARNLFPVSNEGGFAITSITYRSYDKVGAAKLINNYAKDLPRVDVGGKEITIPVKDLGASYGYNIKEIAASQSTGRSLDQIRANAVRRAIEESINEIAFNGNADAGLPGFLSNPNIPSVTVVNGAGGTPQWTTKTPDEILFDVNDLFGDIFENTKMKERADTLLLPPTNWNYIASTPRASNSDTTILQWLVQNSPFLSSTDSVIPVNELVGAGTAGVNIMVAYTRRPDKLQLEIPGELQFFAPQEQGLEFVIPTMESIAGVNLYYPLSAAIAEDI